MGVANLRVFKLPNAGLDVYDVDVPGDGSCLFYSVALAYLMPVISNEARFFERAKNLFGGDTTPDQLYRLHQQLRFYDGDSAYINRSEMPRLVFKFRARVAECMRSNANVRELLRPAFDTDEEFEARCRLIATTRTWGDNYEIAAIIQLLNVKIDIYQDGAGGKFEKVQGLDSDDASRAYDETIFLRRLGEVHYHFLVPKGYFEPMLEQRNEMQRARTYKGKKQAEENASYSEGASFVGGLVGFFLGCAAMAAVAFTGLANTVIGAAAALSSTAITAAVCGVAGLVVAVVAMVYGVYQSFEKSEDEYHASTADIYRVLEKRARTQQRRQAFNRSPRPAPAPAEVAPTPVVINTTRSTTPRRRASY